MLDHKIIIRKPGDPGSLVALYEYDRIEAEIEAEKFRRGSFFRDLLEAGFVVEVVPYELSGKS